MASGQPVSLGRLRRDLAFEARHSRCDVTVPVDLILWPASDRRRVGASGERGQCSVRHWLLKAKVERITAVHVIRELLAHLGIQVVD